MLGKLARISYYVDIFFYDTYIKIKTYFDVMTFTLNANRNHSTFFRNMYIKPFRYHTFIYFELIFFMSTITAYIYDFYKKV
jgi:hypothetical protein